MTRDSFYAEYFHFPIWKRLNEFSASLSNQQNRNSYCEFIFSDLKSENLTILTFVTESAEKIYLFLKQSLRVMQ